MLSKESEKLLSNWQNSHEHHPMLEKKLGKSEKILVHELLTVHDTDVIFLLNEGRGVVNIKKPSINSCIEYRFQPKQMHFRLEEMMMNTSINTLKLWY